MRDETKQQTAVVIRTEDDRVAAVDQARAMLERARTPVDAKYVHDLAQAAERFAKLQKLSKEAVDHAHAIAVDAMARMGEMLKQLDKATGGQPYQVPTGSSREPVGTAAPPTLAEQGITKKQSMLAQSLATAKESKPELYDRVKSGTISITAAHTEVKRPSPQKPAPQQGVTHPVATIQAVPDSRPQPPMVASGPPHPYEDLRRRVIQLQRDIKAQLNADAPEAIRLRELMTLVRVVRHPAAPDGKIEFLPLLGIPLLLGLVIGDETELSQPKIVEKYMSATGAWVPPWIELQKQKRKRRASE